MQILLTGGVGFLGIYLPYFTSNPRFDTRGADAALLPHRITPPRVHEYFERLMEYARDTDFGRRTAE